jgi:hypothetical protein
MEAGTNFKIHANTVSGKALNAIFDCMASAGFFG